PHAGHVGRAIRVDRDEVRQLRRLDDGSGGVRDRHVVRLPIGSRPMDLGRIGIWTGTLDLVPSAQSTEHVAELEELGYGAVWVPEAVGKEAFTNAALLLRGGREIVVATGIASIWMRDPMSAAAAHKGVSEAYPGRFLLGLGVSHAPMVEGLLGQAYAKPY